VIDNTTKNQRCKAHSNSKEELPMKTKNIKVQYSSRYQSGFAPKIQMEGRWLEKLGFPIGTHLVVEYEEGSIRIRPFTEEETAAIEEQKLQAELARKQQEYEAARRSLAKQYGAFTMVAEANSNYGTDSTTRPQRKK
jgi:toxic protein SymE